MIVAYDSAPEGRDANAHVPGLGTACDGSHGPGPCPPPAPAPEAATPDPVAATVAALVELAHNRNGASRIAREGISGRSQERACQLEGEAIGLDAAAELIRRRLAPAWDALAARLAEAEAALEEIEGMWDTTSADPEEMAANMAITAHNALNRLGGAPDAG